VSAHSDRFAADNLPPRQLWPELDRSFLPYSDKLNAAAELLDRMVEGGYEDRPCIRFPGGEWTYGRLLESANRIARVLVEDQGLAPGNRVLLRGPNNAMLAACWYAVLKAGGIAVTTMPLLRARELAFTIDKARIRHALCDARFVDELEQARRGAPMLEHVLPFHTGGGQGLEKLMAGKGSDFANAGTSADDIAIIAFTSGTTGQAKGCMHAHRDIVAMCDLFPPACLRASPDDLFCGSPPLAFTFGLGGLLCFPMRIGAATLLLEQAAPPHLIKGIQDHRATVCFTAPTAYRAMLGMLRDHDVSSLRKCVSAGEHLPVPTFEAWREATGIRIIDGIGATEMLHIFISAAEEEIRPGATGKVVPGYQARIVGEDGRELPRGVVGRLAVKGPTGCRYLANQERQMAYVKDGWNYPGDSFYQDEDGYFWYQARTDDMIISSGYNIAAAEVENVLLEHPAVQECGVVGVPDAERGQLIKAFVVLRQGHAPSEQLVKQLQEFVKAEIAPYKYPRAVAFVESLPRTETGKLQRYRLRESGR
jgi:2-aminobenzoate-CoA ligase